MKLLNGTTVYDFNVSQIESTTSVTSSQADDFTIEFRFRRFPDCELRRSLRLPRRSSETSATEVMAAVLEELEVPERSREDMAVHFRFYLDRLSRRSVRRRGNIPVKVSLDVKEISPERATEIERRMANNGRRENHERIAVVTAAVPARKSAVEGLERERVRSGENEEGECGICLEGFEIDVEVIKMPCMHVYHKDCILRWLQRNHFCPFCRFKLPC